MLYDADDSDGIKLVKAVLSCAIKYVDAVYTQSTEIVTERKDLNGELIRELTEKLDRLRTYAHNSLIDSIYIANRYLFKIYGADKIPVGGVYSGDPIHLLNPPQRDAIGDWAGELVNEVFSKRQRN